MFGVFSRHMPHESFDGLGCFLRFEAFILVLHQHLFFKRTYFLVVDVFHSRASATNPLQHQNSTMFFEVTWSFSSEFGHTSNWSFQPL
jgi:hypothetical protein